MAPKRAAATPASPAKAAKAARRTVEPWQPALDLVSKASCTLPKSCVSMMNAAIPHIFRVTKEERHAYQNTVIAGLTNIGDDEEARIRATIVAVEAEVQSLGTEKDEFSGKYEAAKAEAETKDQSKLAREAESTTKQEAAAAAGKATTEQEAKVLEAEEAVKVAVAKKQSYENEMAGWEALTGCTFAKKDWRLRNKAIAVIVECLKTASAPQSLQAAVSEALKSGPERSEFAKLTLEHGETAMKDHLTRSAASISELEGAVAAQRRAAESAEEAKKVAREEADAGMQVSIDAANVWVEAADRLNVLEKTKAGFAGREDALSIELTYKKDEVEALTALRTKVQALVDGLAEVEEEQAVGEALAQTPTSAKKE